MKKEIRNIVITAIVALFVGYMIGFITQNDRYPMMTDPVVCKDKEKEKSCCSKKNAAKEEAVTPAAEAAH